MLATNGSARYLPSLPRVVPGGGDHLFFRNQSSQTWIVPFQNRTRNATLVFSGKQLVGISREKVRVTHPGDQSSSRVGRQSNLAVVTRVPLTSQEDIDYLV